MFTVRLPDELRAELEAEAQRTGRGPADEVRYAVEAHLAATRLARERERDTVPAGSMTIDDLLEPNPGEHL